MAGYVKLYRQMESWEWYTDTNTKTLFIHCLLRANHKPGLWRGVTIETGSFITSFRKLSSETGLSQREVRTSLNRLKSTHELTHETTSEFSVIKVLKWADYQGNDDEGDTSNDTPSDKQTTSQRQANDKRSTTNKNEKNEKNDKNTNSLKDIVEKVIQYLNIQTNHNYRPTEANTRHLIARINERYTMKQVMTVIRYKTIEWEQNEKMKQFLRPATLFGTKFDTYLNSEQVGRTEAELNEMINENSMHLENMTGAWDDVGKEEENDESN